MANAKHTELTNELVGRIRRDGGESVVSIILYGSGAEGEFHPDYSDLNLLCVLREASFASLAKIAPAVEWWRGKKHQPPLIFGAEEIAASASVFSIEFIDMKQRYRVLYGEDVLRSLQVPMTLHRFQLGYELREKLALLRQHMLLAANSEKQLWEVMLHSLSSFTTLFRHGLLELGEQGRKHSRDAVTELAARMNFDATPFVQVMDVRAGKLERKQISASDLASRYLAAIEHVTTAVDSMQGSAT